MNNNYWSLKVGDPFMILTHDTLNNSCRIVPLLTKPSFFKISYILSYISTPFYQTKTNTHSGYMQLESIPTYIHPLIFSTHETISLLHVRDICFE